MVERTPFKGRNLARGAGLSAPTAPHASPPLSSDPRTGPQRFWDGRGMRRALGAAVLLSVVFHYVVGPWSLLPSGDAIEVRDLDGELTIPVDLLSEAPAETPQASPINTGTAGTAPNEGPGASREAGVGAADATALKTDLDGGSGDGGETVDGSTPLATDDGGIAQGGGDGGTGVNYGRDPAAALGAVAGVNAGPANITVLVNMTVIKAHPEGGRLGPLFAAIPQWKQFMTGSAIDPLRDTDWLMIRGPSLRNTEKDAIFVHYSASDAVVEHSIDAISKTYPKGGSINVGVRGVKAWKAYAEGAERVFLRPSPHVAVIVPATHATQFATILSQHPLTMHFHPGEAMRLVALRPGGSISLIPQTISEMRMWIVPRNADGGADVYAEGDCPDAASATEAAQKLKHDIGGLNSIGVRIVTGGILNGLQVTTDGATVKLHLPADKEQVEAMINLAAAQVGVNLPPAPGAQ